MATILITGCGSGFGAFLAMKLPQLGHDVIASVRSIRNVKDPSFINSDSGSLQYVQMDVTNKSEISRVIGDLTEQDKLLDIVILNAANYAMGTIECADEEQVRNSFEVNYWGSVNVVRSVLPMMRQYRSGKIIGIGSISASIGLPCDGYYSAAKAAMERMLESLRYEVIPFGIHVSVVSPASFNSNLFKAINYTISKENPYSLLLDHWLKNVQVDRKNISFHDVSDVVLKIIDGKKPDFLHPAGDLAEEVLAQLKSMTDQERKTAILDWSDTGWWAAMEDDNK